MITQNMLMLSMKISLYIDRRYCKNKNGYRLFWATRYVLYDAKVYSFYR